MICLILERKVKDQMVEVEYPKSLTVGELKDIIKNIPENTPVATRYRGRSYCNRMGLVRGVTKVHSDLLADEGVYETDRIRAWKKEYGKSVFPTEVLLLGD